ncbi:hypothetical protein ALC57_03032, partial [Trachymyrmex cornetzi]
HLVNIPSLLEALPHFERQRQFVSAMISQGDLHILETYMLLQHFFVSYDALLSLAKYIFNFSMCMRSRSSSRSKFHLHDKFRVNDKFLQIHERWHEHVVEKIVVGCDVS